MIPLRRRVIEDLQIRNLAPRTQITYVEQVDRFARYFRQSPERLGPPEIPAWQLYLAQDKCLGGNSVPVAVAALRLLYTVTLAGNGRSRTTSLAAGNRVSFPKCRARRGLPLSWTP